jgi:SAM-dependent methyltransferase
MRTLPWQNEFDGAFCLGNSFGYCRDEGNLAFLQAIARSLRSGGRFVLDTSYVAETLLPILREREWYPVGDMLVLSDRRYDPEDSRLHVEYTFIRDGQSHKQAMSARIHSYREIRQLLQQAGFAEVVGFGGLAKEPFRLGAKRLLMTAMKR